MGFKPNVSGNPNGRPKGTGSRQRLFKMLVEPHAEALIKKAINLAIEGNESMLRLFLERILPIKPIDDEIIIDSPIDLTITTGLLTYGDTLLKALSCGDMTPQQVKVVMGTLEMQRKNIEATELSVRVSAIERTLNHRK